jgi:organic hydroperoxide reductase OsmC/OhrA
MSEYVVEVKWNRGDAAFTDHRYSRGHLWTFDGGIEVPASSSPSVVRLPMSVEAAVDPEEAFVASLSSCHMLWFLDIAARRKFVVDHYSDQALGVMGKDSTGKTAMIHVTLRPAVRFVGEQQPTQDDVTEMHHQAHEECFIANSVKTEVRCEPVRGVPD